MEKQKHMESETETKEENSILTQAVPKGKGNKSKRYQGKNKKSRR